MNHFSEDISLRAIDLNLPQGEIFAALASFLSEARHLARVPISGFRVGSAALGGSGTVYLGANQEFENLPLNFTVHAEQAAVINARSHGEKKLLALAVSEAPCGYCRQFLTELGSPLQIVLGGEVRELLDLLPGHFSLDSGDENLLTKAARTTHGSPEEIARRAANCSYSPYTGSRSGVCLVCRSGKFFSGSLLESAAYNPSLTALQCALTARSLSGDFDDPIELAVLAEGGKTPLAPLFPAIMDKIAPDARVQIVEL